MRTFGRVCQIVSLLLGFYALCAVLIVGLLVADVLTAMAADHLHALGRYVVLLVLATLGVIVAVLRGVFVSTRVRTRDLPGIAVSRRDQPVLWQRVTDLARAAGTRPPDEIRLVPDVNASVLEHAHLFGLLPGKRRMLIGVPLMLALPLPQFDAVIGHELGHYSGHDVRLGPLTARTRASVAAALRAVQGNRKKTAKRRLRWPGQDTFAAIFQAYAKLVFTSTFATSRQQELAADRFAASIAGRNNAAAALRELPVIDASYDFYLDRYVAAAMPLGLLPPPVELLGGFSAFIRDPRRMAELSALREDPAEEKAHEWDSHPPTAQRVAAILALPDDGRPLDASDVHAIGLLANPAAVLAAIGTQMLGEHTAGKTAADWDTLARAVGAAAAKERSGPLAQAVGTVTGGRAGLTDLLDLVDAGRFGEVLDRLPPSEAATRAKATGRAAREFARTAAGPMLGGWASLELLQKGRASLRHSWAKTSGELVMPAELGAELEAAIEAVLAAKPDTAPLRAVISTTQRSDTEVPA